MVENDTQVFHIIQQMVRVCKINLLNYKTIFYTIVETQILCSQNQNFGKNVQVCWFFDVFQSKSVLFVHIRSTVAVLSDHSIHNQNLIELTVRCDEETFNIYPINVGIPQGSILVPTMYNILTHDIPHSNDTHLVTFADDTAVLSFNSDSNYSTKSFQDYLNELQNWCKLWRVKMNEEKSTHVTFTLRPINGLPLSFDNKVIL